MPPRHIPVGTFRTTQRMHQLINEVLLSEQISYGTKSRQFEGDFARLHGCRYGLLSNSGTSSLQVGLQAMKEVHLWERYHQVIVPATTFIASANVIRHVGLRPVFVDVDPLTFNLDPTRLGEKLTEDTRCIIPVHLLGQPADIEGITANFEHEIKILEDSCECMFASHHGGSVGALGDIAAFSTYVAHILVTGVGGLNTTNNPLYAGKIRSLLNHGLELEQLNPDEDFSPQPMPGRRFLFDTYGHSYRLTEFEAALGLAQLETHAEMISVRRRNAARYQLRLADLNERYDAPLSWQVQAQENTSTPMMQSLVLNPKQGRNLSKATLTQHLNEHGIETRDIPSCLGHKVYAWLSPNDYPVSQWLLESGFYVGCTQAMTIEDVDYVCDCLEGYFAQ